MRRKNDDDLFQESTMSFGEHLDELRTALMRALKWLVLGCAIGLAYGNHVVEFIKKPLNDALKKYYRDQDDKHVGGHTRKQRAAMQNWDVNTTRYFIERDVLIAAVENREPRTSFELPAAQPGPNLAEEAKQEIVTMEQMIRANRRIQELLPAELRGPIDCKIGSNPEQMLAKLAAQTKAIGEILRRKDFYTPESFPYLSKKLQNESEKINQMTSLETVAYNRQLLSMAHPGLNLESIPDLVSIMLWQPAADDERIKPKSMNTQEPFMIYLKGSFLLGFILASPMVFYHLWNFIAAGLYPHEKSYVNVFLPVSITLFLAGAAVAFFFVFQFVLDFLLGFNKWLGIDPELRMSEWLPFALMLPIGFGISFQLPLVMLFLERIGVFTAETYLKKWRIAILAIFIISAVLTPADPYSMMLMAGPLTVLYFGGIMMCKWWPKIKPAETDLAVV